MHFLLVNENKHLYYLCIFIMFITYSWSWKTYENSWHKRLHCVNSITMSLCPQHSSSLHIPVTQRASSSLYSQPPTQYRKRESTASETTTTTLVGGNNFNNGSGVTSKMSNGGGSTVRATSVSPLLIAENAVWKVCHIPNPAQETLYKLLCVEASGILEPAGYP